MEAAKYSSMNASSGQSKPSSEPRKEYDKKRKSYEEEDNEFSEEYSLSDDDDNGDDMACVESEYDDDGREVRNITEKDGKPPEMAQTGKRAAAAAPASTSKTPAEKKAKMTYFEPGPPPADIKDDIGDHSDDRNPATHHDQLHSMIVVNPPPESMHGEDPTTIDGAVVLRDVDPSESTLLEFSIKMKKDWITMQDIMPVLKTVLGAYEAPYSTIRKRTGQMIQGCLHILKQCQHLEMSEVLDSRSALVLARDVEIKERNAVIVAWAEATVVGDSAKERLKEAEESILQLKKKEMELRHVVNFCRDEEAGAKARAEEILAELKIVMSRSDRWSASTDKALVAKGFNIKEE